jgi:hypothetical protein
MHTEVHVHGTVLLKSGVSQTEIELALRSWFDYVDVDGLADARSAHQDEPGIVFDGPTPDSIWDMQRRRMIDDVSALLARHFGDAEIGEATALVNQLFTRRAAEGPQERTQSRPSGTTGKKHLH